MDADRVSAETSQSNMTNDQLLRAIQANYIEYFRPFQTLPDAHWHEDESVTWVLPKGAPGNHILRAELTETVADMQLDALFAELEQVGAYVVRWLLYEHDTPHDLAKRLRARGLVEKSAEPILVRSLEQLPPQPTIRRLKIERVGNAEQLDQWRRATGNGFGGGYQIAGRWSESYRQKGLEADNPFQHYLGTFGGKPATSASIVFAGGIAGIYDVSTVPALRRRGLASAITLAQMHVAKARGCTHAYLRSSREGLPVYQGLGFEVLCYEQEFMWHAPQLDRDGSD